MGLQWKYLWPVLVLAAALTLGLGAALRFLRPASLGERISVAEGFLAVDAIAMDVIVAGYQIQQRNADFIILEDSLSAEEYGVGFKKGNTELRDKVQATLEEMAADGTLKSVSEKWFGEDVTTIGK